MDNRVTQAQADKFGVSLAELKALAGDKDCATYPGETLHVRKSRGGKLTVFNISERARSEKISATKKSRKAETESESRAAAAEAVL